MAIFEPVSLAWGGKEYVLPPTEIMRAIAKVEDVITLAELHRFMSTGKAPLAKLAIAYALLLRSCGARVTEEEVYAGLFTGGELQARVLGAVQVLLAMMIPPAALQAAQAGEGETPPGKTQATAASS